MLYVLLNNTANSFLFTGDEVFAFGHLCFLRCFLQCCNASYHCNSNGNCCSYRY